MKAFMTTATMVLGICALLCIGCSDDEPTNSTPDGETYVLLASHCDPLEIIVNANETITLVTTDTVHTNESGSVADCDFWTDADGIPDCHYVGQVAELNNLSFMALVGSFETDWFFVGTSFDTTLTRTDTLKLKVNDWGPCDTDSDNSGRFFITVTRN